MVMLDSNIVLSPGLCSPLSIGYIVDVSILILWTKTGGVGFAASKWEKGSSFGVRRREFK